MSKDASSVSESVTSSVSTVQNYADSFNQTANHVNNLSEVGNVSLAFGSDAPSLGILSGTGSSGGKSTSGISSLLFLLVVGVIVIAVAIFVYRKLKS